MTVTPATLRMWHEWRALADVLWAQYRQALAIDLQYRVSTAIWLTGAIIEPLVALFVWTTVAKSQGGAVDGVTTQDFAAYFALAFAVGEITYTYTSSLYEDFIRRGDFATHLLRPVHPITHTISNILADKTIRVMMVMVVFILIVLIFQVRYAPPLWSALLFFPALALGTAVYFACDYLVALSAFWVTSTRALGRGFDTMFVLLSGFFAPLQLFPPLILAITWLLPFRWVIAFPIDLMLGNLTPQQGAVGIGIQIIWLAVLAFAGLQLWKRAVVRFSAVGG